MEIYTETILAAGLRGCGFLILLLIWEGLVLIMFHSTGLVYWYDFPSRVDFLIVGLAAAAFGMVIGAMIAADLESEHERYLQDIYRYADEIVQHWWHARPFDGAKKERSGGAS
jgi:hypothetical protein